uniref:Sushi domain-containing protein n=1 Tax=Panagrellus redivivus TaxID=6233 RepID=A0A7E4V0W2_PANRE
MHIILPSNKSDSTEVPRRKFDATLCSPPKLSPNQVVQNLLNWPNHLGKAFFPHGTVLEVACAKVSSPMEKNIFWRCRRGQWQIKGQALICPDATSVCEYKSNPASRVNVFDAHANEFVSFHQHFARGTHLKFTCAHGFMDQLRGANRVICSAGGELVPKPPHCVPLEVHSERAGPPPIHYVVENGAHSISPDGELVVNSSATVHLHCFYPKEFGQPRWETTSTYRTFPQTWSKGVHSMFMEADAYSLTVSMAQPEDSGFYHCHLPNHRRSVVHLLVKDETCAELASSPHLSIAYSSRSLFIGTHAQFTCAPGLTLLGPSSVTCLNGGRWSRFSPKCQPLQCPPLPVHAEHITALTVTSFKFGGIAKFSCARAFAPNSTSILHCGADGSWSHPAPVCEPISCPATVPVPLHGVLADSRPQKYRDGDVVVFGCERGFMLTGSDFVICQPNGKWSRLQARCQAFCRFPGRPRHGNATTDAREYYLAGERIVYYCTSPGHRLSGENVLECQEGGHWSRKLPKCVRRRRGKI